MNFNNHSNLEGQHAFLGASKYHWINYGEDKVAEAYRNFLATQKGTVLHAFAAQCIMLNQKLPKSKQTLNMKKLSHIAIEIIGRCHVLWELIYHKATISVHSHFYSHCRTDRSASKPETTFPHRL